MWDEPPPPKLEAKIGLYAGGVSLKQLKNLNEWHYVMFGTLEVP